MIKNGESISHNRSATFNYKIEDKLEAGLVLLGSEVKSLRSGRIKIDDAYIGDGPEGAMYLYNMRIAEYKFASRNNHVARRPRKILLHKKEMKKLLGRVKIAGYSIIPIDLYFNKRGIVKISIALGKGKNQVDKREVIKEREWNRDKARILKNTDY